jgi:transcriptional regulator with XRE-family HTH domain
MGLIENIEAFLEREDMSQKAFAERVGVSEAAICQFLRGTRQPSFITGMRIAKVIGCRPEDLYKSPSAVKGGKA